MSGTTWIAEICADDDVDGSAGASAILRRAVLLQAESTRVVAQSRELREQAESIRLHNSLAFARAIATCNRLETHSKLSGQLANRFTIARLAESGPEAAPLTGVPSPPAEPIIIPFPKASPDGGGSLPQKPAAFAPDERDEKQPRSTPDPSEIAEPVPPGGAAVVDVAAVTRLLRTVTPFSYLPEDSLRAVASVTRSHRAEPGTPVYLEGAPLKALKIVVLGRVSVTRMTPSGDDILLRMDGPGDLFGFSAAGNPPIHATSATATVRTEYLAVPFDAVLKLTYRHPKFARAFIRLLNQRLAAAEARICVLQTEEAERRVAWALIQLLDDGPISDRGAIPASLRVRREDLAQLAGTNVSTVSRALGAWSRQGIIAAGRKRVVILDGPALRALGPGADEWESERATVRYRSERPGRSRYYWGWLTGGIEPC